MSSDVGVAIEVRNISKDYRMWRSPQARLEGPLWDLLSRGAPPASRLANGLRRKAAACHHDFHALHDVSFQVKRGECLGIVGRNGDGKSTLLQIIAGTVPPTSGEVRVRGRVSALLELGSGFNPDFTGRENASLHGAIQGFTEAEMARRIPEIEAFADIGEFFDQPVKIYSSGMFVRLAFAAAIHVDPDILLVDEALSVGDFAFRNKCFDRINALKRDQVTVVLVTHDLSQLQLFCDRAIWIERGEIRDQGNPVHISQEYHAVRPGAGGAPALPAVPQQNTGLASFSSVTMGGSALDGELAPTYAVGDDIAVEFEVEFASGAGDCVAGLSVYGSDGLWLIGETSLGAGVSFSGAIPGGGLKGKAVLTNNKLAPGDYLVALGLFSPDLSLCYALTDLALRFSVRGQNPSWGRVRHDCHWSRE